MEQKLIEIGKERLYKQFIERLNKISKEEFLDKFVKCEVVDGKYDFSINISVREITCDKDLERLFIDKLLNDK